MKAVFFDFDGVLTTDATGSASICRYIAAETGLDLKTFEKAYYKYNDDLLYGRTTHRDIWNKLCDDLNTYIDITVLSQSFINTPIDNYMISIVRQSKEKNYITGMITDNKKDRMDEIVHYYHWDNLFDTLTVSADIGSGKDHEQIFLSALQSLSLEPNECVFIDNQQKNLIIPRKMGMHVVFFDDVKRNYPELKQTLNDMGVSIF